MTIAMTIAACTSKNPFFSEYENEYGIPPFEKIKSEHYLPAFKEGINQQQAEYDAIANSNEEPTFRNTIVAIEKSGVLLSKVSAVFYNLNSAETNEDLEIIASEVSPLLSEHSDNLYLNDAIFKRVKTLYSNKENLNLNAEQNRVLENYYKNFVRSGANLNDENKEKLREVNKNLSAARLTFGQNLLAENNNYQRYVTDEAELSGLPESVIQAAAEAAKEKGQEDKWLFTLSKASFMPVLQYGENRKLRKDLLLAWANRGDNNNEMTTRKP